MNRAVHPADLPIPKLLADCQLRFQRRSGPGGQHRNKVETGVFLQHQPTGIVSEACEQRSQASNKEVAIQRLRVKLAIQFRATLADESAGEREVNVSDLWRSRLRSQKINVAVTHADFPSLLAEALDWLHRLEFDAKQCAEHLGTTSSQLVKFFKLEPDAMRYVNENRAARELKPLR